MHLVRYRDPSTGSAMAGVLDSGRERVHPLNVTLAELLHLDVSAIKERLVEVGDETSENGQLGLMDIELLAPIDGRMELWAAGVTYERSRDERMKESASSASIYDLVYDAARPELFFKSVAWRVVTDGSPIGVRGDSTINVPEPELAVVVNSSGEIVGYSVCNDVSSRSIEGENPLYLPQAKVYLASAALATGIRPAWEIADPYKLEISVVIERGSQRVYEGRELTGRLHRQLDDLVSWCRSALDFPDGFVLSTGTSLVPELPFTLEADDVVRIAISEIGELANPVVVVGKFGTRRSAPRNTG